MVERGGVTVEDFVELRCFGRDTEPCVEHFAGHTHPKAEFGYRPLYEKLGRDALYAMRRAGWEIREQLERGELRGPHAAEAERFLGSVAWNYTGDKGWLAAMDHFASCVATGEQPGTAGAADGLQATRGARGGRGSAPPFQKGGSGRRRHPGRGGTPSILKRWGEMTPPGLSWPRGAT